jgi:multimeric flavodoxin WrbA
VSGSGGSILKQLECNAVTHTVGDEKAVITHIVAPIYVNNFSALVQRFMDQVRPPPTPFSHSLTHH